MTQILYSALGTLLVLLSRDLLIIGARVIIRRKKVKLQREYAKKMIHHKERLEEWLENFKPEEYGNESNFTLELCDKCDKLKKNLIDNICLECTVNGTE